MNYPFTFAAAGATPGLTFAKPVNFILDAINAGASVVLESRRPGGTWIAASRNDAGDDAVYTKTVKLTIEEPGGAEWRARAYGTVTAVAGIFTDEA